MHKKQITQNLTPYKNSKRESNFDLLRFLAMLGVIINHVADVFLYANDTPPHIITYIFEGFGAFAVPAFMMLTGAFQISDKYSNIQSFYSRAFRKFGIQLILFSIFYSVYIFRYTYITTSSIRVAAHTVMMCLLTGFSGHPLWFLYTLIGIYLLLPLVAVLKKLYGCTRKYHVYSYIFSIYVILNRFLGILTHDSGYSWSVSVILGYMGYVILGNEIKDLIKYKNNILGGIITLFGFFIYIMSYISYYFCSVKNISINTSFLYNYNSPLLVIGSCCIFAGICLLDININFNLTVKYSLYVYLFHRFILDVLIQVFAHSYIRQNCGLYIPIIVALTLVFSLIVSIIYKRILKLFMID